MQALLDLGLMVLTAIDVSPTGYINPASSLSKFNFLNSEDAELLRSMAGLRNILVHAYIGANREIVKESAKKLPKDATRIAEKITSSAKQRIHDPPKKDSDIIKALKKTLKDRVKSAFLFGSQIKDYTLKGDIDVAVYFERRPDPYEVGALVSDIREALKRKDIDILILDFCDNINLAYEAIQGKTIVGDEADILWLKTKITSQYIDYKEKLRYIKST
ncbi:MAG: HepT-like ribonuclease domain-containing protein [Candidatus Bathyarchaeales archaeon]